jgi:hypothetical protein
LSRKPCKSREWRWKMPFKSKKQKYWMKHNQPGRYREWKRKYGEKVVSKRKYRKKC